MNPPNKTANLQTRGLSLKEYAAKKKLPVAFLHSLGLRDINYRHAPAVRMPYFDQLENEICARIRVSMIGQRFFWKARSKPSAYGLGRLEEARQANVLTFVEGESDAQTLWLHGQPALGLPGATTWQDAWACLLAGIDKFYVVVEPDQGGSALMEKLAKSPICEHIHCIRLKDFKDVSDLHLHGSCPLTWCTKAIAPSSS